MVNVVVVIVGALVVWQVVATIQRRRRGLVAERGTSIGADLGTLGDAARVRVADVTRTADDRVHLVLVPDVMTGDGAGDGVGAPAAAELDLVVFLREEEFGSEQLLEWQRSATVLGVVFPPASHLVRLRSIEDLQPLTLRRIDGA